MPDGGETPKTPDGAGGGGSGIEPKTPDGAGGGGSGIGPRAPEGGGGSMPSLPGMPGGDKKGGDKKGGDKKGGDKKGGDKKGGGKGKSGMGKSMGGGAADIASKIPGIGGAVGAIKQALGVIVVYFVIALLAGAIMQFASIVVWLKNGKDNKNSPTGTQCYHSHDNYPEDIRFYLSGSGQNVTGLPPANISQSGQTSQWVDTGFITTGSPLQVYVAGGWYPWGKDVAGKEILIVNKSSMAPDLPPDTDGGAKFTLSAQEVDSPCQTTTDLSFFSDDYSSPTYLSDTPISLAANELVNTRQVNHLLRYSDTDNTNSGVTGIDAQMEEIMNVHCLSKTIDDNNPTNICTAFRPATKSDGSPDTDFTPCYLAHGHGVYMKIGNVNYAYHLANHEVAVYHRVNNPDGTYRVTQAVDDMQTPLTVFVPFSLPTKVYGNFRSWQDMGIVSSTDQDLVPYLGYNNGGNTLTIKQDNLHGTGPNDCYGRKDSMDPNLINETCPPPPGQHIYALINDINYGDNGGGVELIFPVGAKKSATGSGFYNGSVFTTIATWIFSPMFGSGSVINGKSIVQACKTTYDLKGNIVNTGQVCGSVITMRNMFLSNFTFQVFRIILVLIYVTLYGFGLMKGSVQINETDIVKRLLNLSFIMWATNPTNYEFIDNFVLPFFFGAFNELGVIMVNAGMKITNINITVDDPFGIFDVFLGQMFSDVVGYKMIGLVNSNFLFVLGLPLVWIFMVAIVIVLIKSALSYALSIFMAGFFIVIAPLAVLMMLSEYTKQAFDTWTKSMVKESATGVISLFCITTLFALMYKPFQMVFSFDVCWSDIHHIDILHIIKITEYAWSLPNPPPMTNYFLSVLLFAVSTFILLEFKDQIMTIGETLFPGGAGSATSPKAGEEVLNNVIGSLTGVGTAGTGVSPAGMVGAVVGRTSIGKKISPFAEKVYGGAMAGFNDKNLAKTIGKGLYSADTLGALKSKLSSKETKLSDFEKTLKDPKLGLTKEESDKIMNAVKKGDMTIDSANNFIKSSGVTPHKTEGRFSKLFKNSIPSTTPTAGDNSDPSKLFTAGDGETSLESNADVARKANINTGKQLGSQGVQFGVNTGTEVNTGSTDLMNIKKK